MRITSTYVENTGLFNKRTINLWDHLHIRGEYCFASLSLTSSLGSPPHTWRILVLQAPSCTRPRITSTYVENTFFDYLNYHRMMDHLHIRGEYLLLENNTRRNIGSPPHTWRILKDLIFIILSKRITSTYVENTRAV